MKKVLMLAAALALAAAPVFAQDAKKEATKMAKSVTIQGTVSAIAADSLTVKEKNGTDMMLTVNDKTNVQAVGASHKTAADKANDKPTVITDFVHVGDQVSVKYSDSGTAKTATSVRVLSSKPSVKK